MAVTVITGASTGIGLAAALELGRAGHEVWATMRSPDRAPGLREAATREGLPITVLPMDVDDDDSVRGGIGRVLSERGRIDVLVNNAGVAPLGPVEEFPLDEFRRVMETNYFGALRCLMAVLPGMRERRAGCIINVSSVAGRVATGAMGAYAASKFALEAISEVLALETRAFGIRVVCLEPGVIRTPIFDKMTPVPAGTAYPHERRIHALFAASLAGPAEPGTVAEEIRRVVEGDDRRLRRPAGPGAEGLIAWRAAMSDEEWIELNGTPDDESWCARLERDLGLDVRPFLSSGARPRGS